MGHLKAKYRESNLRYLISKTTPCNAILLTPDQAHSAIVSTYIFYCIFRLKQRSLIHLFISMCHTIDDQILFYTINKLFHCFLCYVFFFFKNLHFGQYTNRQYTHQNISEKRSRSPYILEIFKIKQITTTIM